MHCPGNVRRIEMSCTLLQTFCTSCSFFSRRPAFPRGGPAHGSQKHFYQLKICLEEATWEQFLFFLGHAQPGKDAFNLNKLIKDCLLKKLAVRATYLMAKNILSTEARRHSRCLLHFYFIPRPFITLLFLTRVPFKFFPLQ